MTTDATIAPSLSAGRSPRARRGAFAVLGAVALLLASCGTGGDDADTADTTSTTAADATATTEPDGDGTTTTEAADDEGPSDADLEALLPAASDLGPDYREVEDDEDDDDEDDNALEEALEEACPGATDLFGDDEGDDDDKIERTFEDDLGREVTVGFDRSPRNLDEDSLDEVVEVMSQCDTITAVVDGFDMTIDLAIERDDSYGDRGAVMSMALTMDHPQLPAPIDLDFRTQVFVLGPISVMVDVMDGIDEDALVSVPADAELFDRLPGELEAGLADLLD